MVRRLPEVWIDRGGTFIDCIGRDAEGRLAVAKVLSTRGELAAIREVLGLEDDARPRCVVRMGTTLATNALLEKRGCRVGLITHRGLEDLLRIDDQTRPSLFDLRRGRPPPLTEEVVGVSGRIDASGAEVEPLSREEVLHAWRSLEVDAIVIAFAHAHRFPEHERRAAGWLREAGALVFASHEVSAREGLLARAQTALVDAYLTPGLHEELRRLDAGLDGELRIMQSSGDLAGLDVLRAKDAILSGPAGGVVACREIAERWGIGPVLGFDMGGTSTDVCRYDGELERQSEAEVRGVRVRAPMLAIHTVASGGGSICRYDGHRFVVGPQSVGAEPGPRCYGKGDDVALTDAALVLGRLRPEGFPIPLAPDRSRAGLVEIAAQTGRSIEACAQGFLDVAVEQMAAAIGEITIARGHDARDHALVVYGGAAGQYACAVADRLGIRRWVAHPLAGVFSAYGIGRAQEGAHHALALEGPLTDETIARARELAQTIARQHPHRACWLRLRHPGTLTDLEVAMTEHGSASCRDAFDTAHEQLFGYRRPEAEVEVVGMRVHDWDRPEALPSVARAELGEPLDPHEVGHPHRLFVGDVWQLARAVERDALPVGRPLYGPALIVDPVATSVIEPGWRAWRDASDLVWVERIEEPKAEIASTEVDPVRLEVLGNQLMSIASRMGAVLRRAAISTNVRDRMDFSCAIFDREGRLIANAPHIPVHLGSMGLSVRAVHAAHPDAVEGDVFVTNDPAEGGSHLPDVTVVRPLIVDGTLRAFVACRAHHGDIGSPTPGSMPAFSATLADEGCVLRNLQLVEQGRFREDVIRAALTEVPFPARRVDENVADLRAQLAACTFGAARLRELAERYGWRVVDAYMHHLLDFGAQAVTEALRELDFDVLELEDALDDGSPIRVRIECREPGWRIDFTGSAAVHPENLNAPIAVTRACVLYVLRTLVGSPIPLNEGCLRPIELIVPPGLLNPPPDAAVAGGNVETSQRIVDVLLGAFGGVAASQGTMNNVSLGDGRFGYYETLGGGSGAGDGFDGAHAQHTHMTNSHITDVEILEARVPVRVRCFAVRRGSGGAGRWRGGDGLIRELQALAPLQVSVLSQRRERAPFGLAGGEDGAPGRNVLITAGEPRDLGGRAQVDLEPGDVLRIETPGGGGYGTGRRSG